MGWTTSYRWNSRQEVIKDRLEGSFYVNNNNRQIKHTCLAHSPRGTTLWTVWERIIIDLNTSDFYTDRFIGCDLIKCYGKGEDREWGYKDMCESMEPYYYDCPLKFLDMVPKVASEDWRKGVREHHRKLREKAKFKPIKGQIIGLKSCIYKAVEYQERRKGATHYVRDRTGGLLLCRTSMFSGEVFETWPEVA